MSQPSQSRSARDAGRPPRTALHRRLSALVDATRETAELLKIAIQRHEGITVGRCLELVDRSSRPLVTVAPKQSVTEAMPLLVQHRISALFVVERSRVKGMFTRTDCLKAVTEQRLEVSCADLAVPLNRLVVCRAEEPAMQAMARLREKGIKHLPVVAANGEVENIVTYQDLLACLQRCASPDAAFSAPQEPKTAE